MAARTAVRHYFCRSGETVLLLWLAVDTISGSDCSAFPPPLIKLRSFLIFGIGTSRDSLTFQPVLVINDSRTDIDLADVDATQSGNRG